MDPAEDRSADTPPDAGVPSRSTTTPRPKQRRLRACDSCRQRKIRCDRLPGSCRNCKEYGEQCIISRGGAIFPRPRGGQAARRRVQNRSDSGSGPTTPGAEPTRGRAGTAVGDTAPIAVSSAAESEPVQGVVTTEVGQYPKNAKYAGLNSPQVLARIAQQVFSPYSHMNVMDFFCPMMTFAVEFPLVVPGFHPLVVREMADKCVQRYFATYHILFPILDEPTFRQNYETFYEPGRNPLEAAQAILILLVIALGATSTEIFDSHLASAFNSYNSLVARPYQSSVQALILMTLCFLNAAKDGQAILCIAYAAQMAQSIGLHRSLSIYRHPREIAFVLKDYDLRNCIWWICYCLDKKLSFENGQVSAIHDDECDAELPELGPLSPAVTETHRSSSFTFISSFISLAKTLSSISRRLFHRSVSSVNNDELVQRIAVADRDLLLWRDSLPEELQPDKELYAPGDEVTETGSAMLHCMYYNALLIIHRASLVSTAGRVQLMKKHTNRRIAASDVVCLGAARSLVHSVNNLVVEPRGFPVLGWMHPYTTNAVMILYIGIMQSPLRWLAPNDLALMRSMQLCFEKSRDPGAGSRFTSFLACLTEAMEKSKAVAQLQSFDSSSTWQRQDFIIPPSPASSHMATANSSSGDCRGSISHGRVPSMASSSMPGPLQGQNSSSLHGSLSDGWTMSAPASDPFATPVLPNQIRIPPLHGGEGLQFGELFGDHWAAWNMQLWPLVGEGGMEGANNSADMANYSIS